MHLTPLLLLLELMDDLTQPAEVRILLYKRNDRWQHQDYSTMQNKFIDPQYLSSIRRRFSAARRCAPAARRCFSAARRCALAAWRWSSTAQIRCPFGTPGPWCLIQLDTFRAGPSRRFAPSVSLSPLVLCSPRRGAPSF